MLRPLKLISSTNVNFDLGHLPGQICDQISLNGLTQLFSCIFFSFLKSLALQKRHSLHRLQAVDIADSAIWRRKATMSICARRTPAIITRLSPPLSQGHLLPKRFKYDIIIDFKIMLLPYVLAIQRLFSIRKQKLFYLMRGKHITPHNLPFIHCLFQITIGKVVSSVSSKRD